MVDLFEREQLIYDEANKRSDELKKGSLCRKGEFEALTREYGRLLRQLRRVTKLSDKTTEDLNAHKQDLLDKVHYDALTGIYNRRFMEENLERVLRSVLRSDGELCVMMLDIDYFKRFNDTYGHSAGDDCLKTVAEAISGVAVRADDFAARYGGEEFAVILPNTDEQGAAEIAQRLLESVRALQMPHETSEAADCVTVSIGAVSGRVKSCQIPGEYIEQADKALYMSKENGRNRYTYLKMEEAGP